MYEGKPIIGVAGGIAAGKTHLARLFGSLGGCVISSDALVRTAYTHPAVKRAVSDLLGPEVFTPDGAVDQRAVGGRVFRDLSLRQKLEAIVHPVVNEARLMRMQQAAEDEAVLAYVWDSPLLFETGLDRLCDAVVFVDTPDEVRLGRARERGWDEAELRRRENLQWPLDKKRAASDDVVRHAAGPAGGVLSPPSHPSADAAVESFEDAFDDQARRVFGRIIDAAAAGTLRRRCEDAPPGGCGSGCGCRPAAATDPA